MNPVPAERLQRGGCHRAMLFNILFPGLRFAHPGLSRRNEIKTELSDSCRPLYITTFDSSAAAPFGENGY